MVGETIADRNSQPPKPQPPSTTTTTTTTAPDGDHGAVQATASLLTAKHNLDALARLDNLDSI